jgi:hypothetical protein
MKTGIQQLSVFRFIIVFASLFSLICLEVGDSFESVDWRLFFRAPERIAADLILETPHLEFIAGDKLPFGDALTIDLHPIRAAQIANDEVIVDLGNHAVPPRHLLRVQLHIALFVTAEKQDGLIDLNARPIVEREEMRRHGKPPKAISLFKAIYDFLYHANARHAPFELHFPLYLNLST